MLETWTDIGAYTPKHPANNTTPLSTNYLRKTVTQKLTLPSNHPIPHPLNERSLPMNNGNTTCKTTSASIAVKKDIALLVVRILTKRFHITLYKQSSKYFLSKKKRWIQLTYHLLLILLCKGILQRGCTSIPLYSYQVSVPPASQNPPHATPYDSEYKISSFPSQDPNRPQQKTS